jgi:CelD/BcsL family acetyltransferase involved in cellulose biosynthesis
MLKLGQDAVGRAAVCVPNIRGVTEIGASCTAPTGVRTDPESGGAGLSCQAVDTIAGLAGLRRVWEQLASSSEEPAPFLTWEWQEGWWAVFAATHSPRTLVFSQKGEVVGIAPLCVQLGQEDTLQFAGGEDLSDQLGILARPGFEDAVADGVVDWARASGSLELDLHFLRDWGWELPALQRAVERQGLFGEVHPEEVSPAIDLPTTFDEYLALRLGKKDRHELRRKMRRLEQERPGWRLVGPDELGLERALTEFLHLLRASREDKDHFLTPVVERFFREVAERFHRRGWLRLALLEEGGRLAAGTFGFCLGRVWYLYNSGYDPGEAHLSPGLLCVAEGVRGAIEAGCHQADLLRGNEPYKYRLGAQDQFLVNLRVRLTEAAR